MFYIHQTSCISPQQTFSGFDLESINQPIDNKFKVIEPSYEGIPLGILRRMGKAVRIGVGAALPLLQQHPDGIIIGTANGGMEDCIKFLNQIIDYKEGMLAPGNFVQSTTNAIAAQLGLMSKNKGYNITHVHRGLAFENAMIDTDMLLAENPDALYLLGGVDEISSYNYNIDYLDGWYKKEAVPNNDIYGVDSMASIAGEGVAMFLANKNKIGAIACLEDVLVFQTDEEYHVSERLQQFLDKHLAKGEKIDLFISGENGDNRMLKYYTLCETFLGNETTIARFKHMTGEYPTASAIAAWLACQFLHRQVIPAHMIKKNPGNTPFRRVLIYNTYKGVQHSFMLLAGMAG